MIGRLLTLLACATLTAAAPRSDRSVAYTLSPEFMGPALSALRVRIAFAADPSGTTTLAWPSSWAGDDRLSRWAQDIRVSGAASVAAGGNGTRTIRAAPGARIVVTYRVVSAYAADPTVEDSQQSYPVVRPTWFYAAGEALFAAPQGRDDSPATFAWTGAPAGFGFASDLQHRRGSGTLAGINESIVIGGRDLRITNDPRSGVRVATIGDYTFAPAAFDALSLKVVAAVRDFWREPAASPFLITMTPMQPRPTQQSYSGTGRGDAFALWVGADIPLARLGTLLAHEYFHSWNPARLGGLDDTRGGRLSTWFSEGFTDFYTRRLLVRAGLASPREFADAWNAVLADYAASPYRATSNSAAAKLFWSNEGAQKLPYQRGALLAALWDARQRDARGVRLDDVLRRQLADPRAPTMWRTGSAATLFALVARGAGLDVRADIARFVDRGEPVALAPDTFGPCARVATTVRPAFERGWDADATERANNIVTGLDAASPAFAAGLRNGMRLLRRSEGIPGDSRVRYVMQVDDAGTTRTIAFRPEGRARVTVQEVVLDAARVAADPDGCARSLGGA